MLHILLTGTVYETPVQRIAKNGNPFATAKLLADVGDGSSVWCSVIAFAEAGEHLALLQAGDAVSMTGKARLNQWEDQNGKPRAGLAVTATGIMALPRPSTIRLPRSRTVRFRPELPDHEAEPFDDDLSFLDAASGVASAVAPAGATETGETGIAGAFGDTVPPATGPNQAPRAGSVRRLRERLEAKSRKRSAAKTRARQNPEG